MANRRTSIRFPVFKYTLIVIQARDIVRTGKRLGVDLEGCGAAFVYVPGIHRGHLLFEMEADESTIAHEASHAVRAMFKSVGARSDDETFAYHLGHLVGRLHRFLK